jgi:hypothetical protein
MNGKFPPGCINDENLIKALLEKAIYEDVFLYIVYSGRSARRDILKRVLNNKSHLSGRVLHYSHTNGQRRHTAVAFEESQINNGEVLIFTNYWFAYAHMLRIGKPTPLA